MSLEHLIGSEGKKCSKTNKQNPEKHPTIMGTMSKEHRRQTEKAPNGQAVKLNVNNKINLAAFNYYPRHNKIHICESSSDINK